MAFVRHFWTILEPNQPFVEGWAIEAIAEHLEAVHFGQINRLLINVPPGFSKPAYIEEPVITKRGVVRLGDIVVGDMVLTHKGRFRLVQAVHEQGMLPLLKITTEYGRVVRTAPDHPFLTPRGWVQAQHLTGNDYCGVPRVVEFTGANGVSPEEARLLGYLVGDGNISQRAIGFTSADQESIDDFIYCAKACGFFAYEKKHANPNVKARYVVLKSTEQRWRTRDGEQAVLVWLKKHGLYRTNSYTKHMPQAIFVSGQEAIANFVGAYWSCDGTVFIRHAGKKTTMGAVATTVSKQLAEDLQIALLLLNIQARLRVRDNKRISTRAQPGGVYRNYAIQATTRHEVAKIAKLPGLLSRKRLLAENGFLDRFEPPLYADNVISAEPDGSGLCRCLTVEEDASFTIKGLAVHNSLLTNCFFPAWEWSAMDRADHRYVSFSYAAHLTRRDNRKLINLLKSQRFAELWGRHRNFELVKEGEELVSTNRTGWKFATSVGGVGTGERGSRILLDDPHNVKDTESDIVRNGIVRWFRESMSNRLNNETDAIVVIMQRVHEDDVSGNIIADTEGLGYTQLRVPMEYLENDPCSRPTSIGWTDPRTTTGELAWPERYSAPFLRQFKIISYMWSAQYLQEPEPRGGAIILRDWWRLWEDPEAKRCPHCNSSESSKVQSTDPNSRWCSCNECGKHFLSRADKFPYCSYILASLDTSYTEKERNDPSAMTVWGIFQHPKTKEPGIILMDAWRKWLRMNAEPMERFPNESDFDFRERSKPKWGLVEWTVHTCRRFKADCLLIENRASGITLMQELQLQYGREIWTTIMKQPEGDKEARAHSVVGIFANKLVWAPDRDFATLMIEEAAKFPFGKYRDLTDSMTQALRHIRNLGLIQFEEERIAEEAEGLLPKAKLQPLYPV